MTRPIGDPPPPKIRVLGGSPDYLAATGLRDQHGTPFDEALTLARLVILHGGGPVPLTGRKAPFTARHLRALAKRGWVDLLGDSVVTPEVRVTSVADLSRVDGGWTARRRSSAADEKTGWRGVASDEGRRQVSDHLARQRRTLPPDTAGEDSVT